MAREIPEVVRAAAGLAATVLDEAQKLPETLPGLPVRVLGVAMQLSMKLQQHYAGLVARGDELLTGMRGEDEPGLATFDDDEPAAESVNTSAFDRAAETIIDVTDDGMDDAADADARAETDEVLDELAIDELVDETPAAETPAAQPPAAEAADRDRDADGLPEPEVLATSPAEDGAGTVDVLAADGGIDTVEATVTDEGVAAAEGAGAPPAPATAEPLVQNSLKAPLTAPVDGYDDWSIAQLRGRMRGYVLSTVSELVAYEEATRAREPYLRMLRNRLEKLEEQAVENSPLAPRGS